MNIKNLSLLMACAFAVPAYATEEVSVVNQTEEVRDYAKEDAANTKVALAEAGIFYGAAIGAVAGVANGSMLIGGAICAMPIAAYCGLRYKYKKMFDEKAYERVCDTDNGKLMMFTLGPIAIPVCYGALGYLALYVSSLFGSAVGGIAGTCLGKLSVAAGITNEAATMAALAAAVAVPTVFETKTELEKQKLEHEKAGLNCALSLPEKCAYFFPKYCKNIACAFGLLTAIAYTQAQYPS